MGQDNRSLHDRFMDSIRVFNKYIFNHLTLFLARRGIGPFSVIIHKERRSGRTYQTPVLASHVGEKIIIPLSYGDHVDWLRNILAQGCCEMIWRREKFLVTSPNVIDAQTAAVDLPPNRRDLLLRFDIDQFLSLQRKEDDVE